MKNKIELNAKNYYSKDMSKIYMSASQYKDFEKCHACAVAKINGEWESESGTALLVGSYVDSYFEGNVEAFKQEHPQILKKDGGLRAEYVKADDIIRRVETDDFFMAHISGETQKIMTGEIGAVPFKIKIDFFHDGQMIVDLKIMKDFEWVFDPVIRKRVPFVEYWGYDIQGAIYQEIVRQNTGDTLPFYIAGATKESETDIALIAIPQEQLNFKLGQIKKNAPFYNKIKYEQEPANRCEKCDYCKNTKVLNGYVSYENLGNG